MQIRYSISRLLVVTVAISIAAGAYRVAGPIAFTFCMGLIGIALGVQFGLGAKTERSCASRCSLGGGICGGLFAGFSLIFAFCIESLRSMPDPEPLPYTSASWKVAFVVIEACCFGAIGAHVGLLFSSFIAPIMGIDTAGKSELGFARSAESDRSFENELSDSNARNEAQHQFTIQGLLSVTFIGGLCALLFRAALIGNLALVIGTSCVLVAIYMLLLLSPNIRS